MAAPFFKKLESPLCFLHKVWYNNRNKIVKKGGIFDLDRFIIHSDFKPTGDQPQAIKKIVDGINQGLKEQVNPRSLHYAKNGG